MSLKEKSFEILVAGAESAASRSRWALATLTVLGIAQLSAVYNYVFSQWRPLIEHLVLDVKEVSVNEKPVWLDELNKQVVRGWVENLSVSNSLLGVRFSAVDVGLVASLAMALLYLWLYFSSKNEFSILRRAALSIARVKNDDDFFNVLNYLFHGLICTQMFIFASKNNGGGYRRRRVSFFIVWFPALSLLCSVFFDLVNLFLFPALFRGKKSSYFYLFLNADCVRDFGEGHAICAVMLWYSVKMLFLFAVLVIIVFLCLHICRAQMKIDVVMTFLQSKLR